MYTDLTSLKEAALVCAKCSLWETRRKVVFGEGNPGAKLLFLGEAPGGKEDETGLPFVGEAGLNLNRCLEQLGIAREEIYLTSPVKCRPTKTSPRPRFGQYANRKPTAQELAACREWMEWQIKLINPAMIVTLGDVPLKEIMGKQYKVGECHGRLQRSERHGCLVFPLYHPAASIYDRKKEADFARDLALLKQEIDKIFVG